MIAPLRSELVRFKRELRDGSRLQSVPLRWAAGASIQMLTLSPDRSTSE